MLKRFYSEVKGLQCIVTLIYYDLMQLVFLLAYRTLACSDFMSDCFAWLKMVSTKPFESVELAVVHVPVMASNTAVKSQRRLFV